MRRLLLLLLCSFVSSCITGAKHAINLYGGGRTYDGQFGEVDDAPAIGLEGMIGVTDHGLSIEGGYAYSENSSGASELKVDELYAGIRKTFWSKRLIQPYLGVGANFMQGDAQTSPAPSATGDGWGAYLRGGVGFQIALFQAGIDLRGSTTSAEVAGQKLDYLQTAIFIGVSL